MQDHIASVFADFGIPLSGEQLHRFSLLLERFLAYNAHTNLSAIRDAEGVIVKHLLDSVALLRYHTVRGSLLDIGTGGGFPGIPLAIMSPECTRATLMDSVKKKTTAVETFAQALEMPHIQAVWARAEEYAKNPWVRRTYDTVVSRATAYLPTILEWSEPFLAPHGTIIIYKTPSDEEYQDGMQALPRLKLSLKNTHTYTLAGQDRTLLFFVRGSKPS